MSTSTPLCATAGPSCEPFTRWGCIEINHQYACLWTTNTYRRSRRSLCSVLYLGSRVKDVRKGKSSILST